MTGVQIRPFRPHEQDAARNLILAGLGDHFEVLNPTLNPDLDDIQGHYVDQGDCFLVAVDGDDLVGTGALIRESGEIGRIVRMSVAANHRRQGIARRLVEELILNGRKQGYTNIVVETNDDWFEAIRLYEGCGFRPYDQRDGEIHMLFDIVEQN